MLPSRGRTENIREKGSFRMEVTIFVGSAGRSPATVVRVRERERVQRLEKAEFFIVDLYFYGSGCYPLGRGRIQGVLVDWWQLSTASSVIHLYSRDRTGLTKKQEKESGKECRQTRVVGADLPR
jgi:hypothetical protein